MPLLDMYATSITCATRRSPCPDQSPDVIQPPQEGIRRALHSAPRERGWETALEELPLAIRSPVRATA